jgi:hypothetical protein
LFFSRLRPTLSSHSYLFTTSLTSITKNPSSR